MIRRILFFFSLLLLLHPQLLLAGSVTNRINWTKTLVVGTPGDFPPFAK